MELSAEQIRRQYELEKRLGRALLSASREERRTLYAAAYEEFHLATPELALLTRKSSPEETRASVEVRLRFLKHFLKPDTAFMEVGAGDCSLSLEVARRVKSVVAVEVSNAIAEGSAPPPNFRLLLSDALSIPTDAETLDVVYSNDFIEHLHPEDALEHLRQTWHRLKAGGVCICLTPSRVTGPHDVSRFFDEVSTGLHLKEYSAAELNALFLRAGFSKTRILVAIRRHFFVLPVWPVVWAEFLLERLPRRLARKMAARFPLRHVLGVNMAGIK